MTSNALFVRGLVASGAVVALTASALLAPAPADATSRLHCRASVTPKHPSKYSYIDVIVHTKAHAKVRTTAHYKTTSTSHSGHAGAKGVARVEYYISGATSGRKVPVTVTVKRKHHKASCSTSFTPR